MLGKRPRLSPLHSRKQILIAESELNRALLIQEWQSMVGEAQSLADRAKSWGMLASSAAVLATGLAAIRRNQKADPEAKPTWFQSIVKGAGLVSTFWMAFRSPRRDPKNP